MMILIADSGSTKTAWCLLDKETKEKMYVATQGINPFQQSEEAICGILQGELMSELTVKHVDPDQIEAIFFYGAGCTKEKSPVMATALRKTVSNSARICVESDMLGASRGLCGRQPGIVCILGTGSNSCYYNGRDNVANVSPLGYILGDEGSGAYIGKRLAGDVLKRQMPEEVCKLFYEETHETQASIIQKVYREPMPNRFLASLSPFCARHREMEAIHALLIDSFSQFFKRNIDQYEKLVGEGDFTTVHFVGSIATYYEKELREAAKGCGYSVGNIMQGPLEGLVAYHEES